MFILIILLFLMVTSVPYVAVGARVARQRYALEKYNYQLALTEANSVVKQKEAAKQRIAKWKRDRDALPHKSYCFLVTPSLRDRGCMNCDDEVTRKWKWYNREIKQLEEEGKLLIVPAEPKTPYRTIVTWPVVKLGDYLTSGEVKRANHSYIAELERLNGMEVK